MNARLLTAAVALTVGSVVCHADGLPQERAPAQVAGPCCEYVPTANWTGVYVGLHAGAARSKTGWTFPFDETFNTAAGQNFPTSAEGGAVGGHLGVNYQFWRILVGAEVSYTLANLSDIVIGPIAGSPTDRFKLNERDLFTLTGRLGVTHDKFLLYGKAGFASSIVEVTAFSPPTGVTAQLSQRANGWIVGGGLDTRIFSDVLLGVEYNYVTLSGERFSALTTAAPPGPFNVDIRDIHMQTVVARLSILFGPNACCHDGLFGKY